MSFYLIKKILLAVCQCFRFWKKTQTCRIIMTLLVKNEGDILEENLLFHKNMGVDALIVTDKNSSDGTLDIIHKYVEKGWIIKVIKEESTNYEQKEWVDRMVWAAKTEFNADWVINADADELWYVKEGNLKTYLKGVNANVLNCRVINVYPEETKPIWMWNRIVHPIDNIDKYNLSSYSIFGRQYKKVMHRTDGYIQISMGNHKVAMFPKKSINANVVIYHYLVRGRDHFMNKMINGGKQLEQHKGRHGGRHWRYFYQLYNEGKLQQEYDRVIGVSSLEQLVKDGYIVYDNTIPEFFKSNILLK